MGERPTEITNEQYGEVIGFLEHNAGDPTADEHLKLIRDAYQTGNWSLDAQAAWETATGILAACEKIGRNHKDLISPDGLTAEELEEKLDEWRKR